jgi:hypothetical protein
MKTCSKCKIDIPKTYRSGLCTKCRKHKNYLDTNGKNYGRFVAVPKEQQLESKRESAREYYHKNKEEIKEKQKQYRGENRQKFRDTSKNWYENNGRDYYSKRYNNDIDFKIRATLRSRLNSAIKINQKAGSAVSDLGCSIDELKSYLESKFEDGMTWDNWTRDGWHIDHIKPLASFDLTNEEQFKKACHYSNLQPLWAEENLKKGIK